MINIQPSLFDELIVDNFAGGGGASTGLELAFGRPVDIAVNHDPDAILMHKTNHPYTRHYCESVWDIDPVKVCEGRKVALAWFSPDCKHFSKAKGGKPVEKRIRGLAWVAVKWAATVRPRVIMLENVEEFRTWGPLDDTGRPDPLKKGRTFTNFVNELVNLGYQVCFRELKACDYGAPTTRKRFFLIARCDGRPIVWPEPTHGTAPGLEPYRTAADIIDWSLPCPSIFERKRPLAENTMRRIARGIQKFVIDNPDPFVIQVNHSGEAFRGQSTADPLQTVTAKNGYGIVTPVVTKFQQNSIGQTPELPLDTVMPGAARFGVVAPVVSAIGQTGFSADRSYPVEEPVRTLVSKAEQCLISPTLIQIGYGEAPGQLPRVPGIDKPLGTVVSSGKHALVSAFIAKHYGGNYQGAGSDITEPVHTVTCGDHNALVVPFVSKFYKSGIGQQVNEPLHTVTTSAGHFAEVRAFLLKYYGAGTGQKLDDPLGTVTVKDRFGLVVIKGEQYRIVDIGMRMLQPHELYAAQGFPADYIIDRDYKGNKYPKTKQVARCGNAVPPPFAKALAQANLPELVVCDVESMEQFRQAVAAI